MFELGCNIQHPAYKTKTTATQLYVTGAKVRGPDGGRRHYCQAISIGVGLLLTNIGRRPAILIGHVTLRLLPSSLGRLAHVGTFIERIG